MTDHIGCHGANRFLTKRSRRNESKGNHRYLWIEPAATDRKIPRVWVVKYPWNKYMDIIRPYVKVLSDFFFVHSLVLLSNIRTSKSQVITHLALSTTASCIVLFQLHKVCSCLKDTEISVRSRSRHWPARPRDISSLPTLFATFESSTNFSLCFTTYCEAFGPISCIKCTNFIICQSVCPKWTSGSQNWSLGRC